MPLFTYGNLGVIAEVPDVVPEVPVVYLHGWERSRRDLKHIERLRPGMLLDLPGFGSSPVPTKAIGSKEYAIQVLEAITQWTITHGTYKQHTTTQSPNTKHVVVGHSFGGRVAIQLALLAPQKIRGLIISGTPLFRNHPHQKSPLSFRAIKKLRQLGLVSEARLESARRKHGSVEYLATSGVMREVFVRVVNESYEQALSQIRCPTAFVWGTQDSSAPVADAVKAQKMVNGSFLETRKCGHNIHISHPEVFVDYIDRFSAP